MLVTDELLRTEEGFTKIALEQIEPYLKDHETRGSFESFDGKKIAYRIYQVPDAKASVMLIHGFSEFLEKYNEMMYVLLHEGFNVYVTDLRGHGDSERFIDDPSKVEVHHFNDYIKDLRTFYDLKVKETTLPKYLLGHSMGGGIAIQYMEMHCEDFSKAVFSSPMVRMRTGKFPFWVVRVVSALMKLFGKGTEFAAGQHSFNPASHLDRSSCKSPERYEYIMDKRRAEVKNQTWGGTYNWANAAAKNSVYILKQRHIDKITVPALVLCAGLDHMVKPEFIDKFAKRLPNGKYIFFPNARHEIYHADIEDRVKFYEEVVGFLNS